MKILLVNRALPHHVAGGLEQHTEDLALGLAGAGLDVHVLSAALPAELQQEYRDHGITPHASRCARPARYTLKYMACIGREIMELLGRERFDVVHGQEFALGCWLPSHADPPMVLSVHGTITSETPLHRDIYAELDMPGRWHAWRRFGRRHLFRPVWRAAMRHAATVLVDSEFTLNELIDRESADAARLRIVPLAVRDVAVQVDHQSARGVLEIDNATLNLFTIGRIEWQKGHELALAALAELREFPWRYTIAGDGGHRAELERRVSALGIADRVVFAGRVNAIARERLLAAADLFIWPERTHPAFGLVGLESMLQGTPVLASARGAIPEVLAIQPDPETWLVRDVTRDGFRAKLHALLRQPRLLREARSGLRERALGTFGFERMIESVIDVYRNARSQ